MSLTFPLHLLAKFELDTNVPEWIKHSCINVPWFEFQKSGTWNLFNHQLTQILIMLLKSLSGVSLKDPVNRKLGCL